jgi:hypothetical protein
MVQGKEIRIGNYLKDRNGNVLRVDFIEYVKDGFDTKFGQKMTSEEEEFFSMTEYSNYAEPIKLTEEWVQKLGFEKTDDYGDIIYYAPKDRGKRHYYICFDHDVEVISFGLSVLGNCICIIYGGDNLKYVHQFQNLYYALTGVELVTDNCVV